MTRKGSQREKPIGYCIYCGLKPSNINELSREHILPKGLGGKDTLLRASCAACARITAELERVFIRDTVWALRSLIVRKGAMRVPDSKHMAVLPVLLPPSLLGGPRAPPNTTFRLHHLTAEVVGTRPGPLEIKKSKFAVSLTNFCSVLAKIAHGYAIKTYGGEAFEPFLPNVILGKITHPPDIWRYIGGAAIDWTVSSPHVIGVRELQAYGDRLISVHLKLFAQLPVPSYHVLAGRFL